jgi:hypothetical protein
MEREMFRKLRVRLIAAGVAAAALASAVPAQAYYVVTYFNSYGGGGAVVCDNGSIYSSWGVLEGEFMVTSWNPGQPPC